MILAFLFCTLRSFIRHIDYALQTPYNSTVPVGTWQTIHNVIAAMRQNGILVPDETHSKGREKAFILSDKGETYAADFLNSLDTVEGHA